MLADRASANTLHTAPASLRSARSATAAQVAQYGRHKTLTAYQTGQHATQGHPGAISSPPEALGRAHGLDGRPESVTRTPEFGTSASVTSDHRRAATSDRRNPAIKSKPAIAASSRPRRAAVVGASIPRPDFRGRWHVARTADRWSAVRRKPARTRPVPLPAGSGWSERRARKRPAATARVASSRGRRPRHVSN